MVPLIPDCRYSLSYRFPGCRLIPAFNPIAVPVLLILLFVLLSMPGPSEGSEPFRFNNQNDVIGEMATYTVKDNESLYELARRFKTGYNEIVDANRDVDPLVPGKGKSLIVPTSWVLPNATTAPGIVINLSEMRLYYYFKKSGTTLVRTYPIGIGDEGAETPLGTYTIVEKIPHPAWYVPDSIRKEKPELPAVVPPGPDNPMGSHALRLSKRTVLIHGTDMAWGIGRRVSHGCIRLYPEDIVELFGLIKVNTRVTIVEQPVKVGMADGRVFVEVNADSELPSFDYAGEATKLLSEKGLVNKVDTDKLARAVSEKKGFPVDISREHVRGT